MTNLSEPTIRLPMAVDLPSGWRQVDPGVAGGDHTAFAAVREPTPDPVTDTTPRSTFTPTITVELGRTDQSPDFVAISEAAAGRVAAQAAELKVLERAPISSARPPTGMTQIIWMRTPSSANGPGVELIHSQVQLGIGLDAAGRDTVLVQLTCTSTPQQSRTVAREFEQFVASFRLRPTEPGRTEQPDEEDRDER